MADTDFEVPVNVGTIAHRSGTASGKHHPANCMFLFNGGDPVPISSTNPAPTTSGGYQSIVTITRPANINAYLANDVVGGRFTLANIGPSGGHILLTSLHLDINIAAVPSGMGNILIFLYDTNPASNIADNGVFARGSDAGCLTKMGLSMGTPAVIAGGGKLAVEAKNLGLQIKLATASTSLFGYWVTTTAYTPANNSETAELTAYAMGV
jgi:hypothetical protein